MQFMRKIKMNEIQIAARNCIANTLAIDRTVKFLKIK